MKVLLDRTSEIFVGIQMGTMEDFLRIYEIISIFIDNRRLPENDRNILAINRVFRVNALLSVDLINILMIFVEIID